MFKEISKVALIPIVAFCPCLIGCSSEQDKQKAEAEALVDEARNAIEQKRYTDAFVLMDSVDKAYPQQIDSRRAIIRMRSEAMTAYSEAQLLSTDSLISVLEAQMAEMAPKFEHVGGGDLTGYYVAKNANRKGFLASTGIESRVDDEDYYFYIVAVNNGKPIGINQITLSTPTSSYSSARLPDSSERSGDVAANGTDLATFMLEEVDSLASWAVRNSADIKSVILRGKKGETTVKLTPQQAATIGATWQFADVAARLQRARVLRDKYQQQLIISRDHSVNLP